MAIILKFPGVGSRVKKPSAPDNKRNGTVTQLGWQLDEDIQEALLRQVAQEKLRAEYWRLMNVREVHSAGPPPLRVADLTEYERYSVHAEIAGDRIEITYTLPLAEAIRLRNKVRSTQKAIVKHGSVYYLKQLREPIAQLQIKLNGADTFGMVSLAFEGKLDTVRVTSADVRRYQFRLNSDKNSMQVS